MKKMSSAELRSAFLNFFKEHGHSVQSSSSLVPGNDPTLLFTNAGMVPFKDVFLGREKKDYTRAVSTQRCVRAGGKHNDLENVGYTARHHTFFEMLGNFSFGDYFKQEAIQYAWQFLTVELEIPSEKLWVTVYEEDPEAEKIWLEDIKISPERFSRIGKKDNFWSMGEVGPCGPCSEIFYDHGAEIAGGPPGSPDEDGDRYIEIWNIVFMQFNRDKDGNMQPLPAPSVDTGMGLERITAVLQSVHNNYEIDLFKNLLAVASEVTGQKDTSNSSLRVIADHIRSCAFMIVDGVLPSNEGRGYVLRRIIRRAIRHGYRLGCKDTFFYRLVDPLVKEMGTAFPELSEAQEQVKRVLKKEEERFAETLEQGMKILDSAINDLNGNTIPGDKVFLLYDTYGFPVDLTADYARENQLSIDEEGFEAAMADQRQRAKAGGKFNADYDQDIQFEGESVFTGYQCLDNQTLISGLYQQGQTVEQLSEGDEGVVILEQTPFYAESGGQVGDQGQITSNNAIFQVHDTQKQGENIILHKGIVKQGQLNIANRCEPKVSSELRSATELNHSATHLLHAALRNILGDHVNQKGSLVNADRLRFDFSHFEPVTQAEISQIEQKVNAHIRANVSVTAELMNKDEAIQAGAMALFGEKYGDQVRVLSMGEFSTELCGGTHVERTGDIGCFKIIGETGVAAGIRRIEAVTGKACLEWIEKKDKILCSIADAVKTSTDKTSNKVIQLVEKNKQLEKELEKLKSKLASSAGGELSSKAVKVGDINVLAARIDEIDNKAMRDMVDQLKNKLGTTAIVLATVKADKVSMIAGVSKDLVKTIKAGELVNSVASQVGGKGGGRADMAQAGGSDPGNLETALNSVPTWIEQQLN